MNPAIMTNSPCAKLMASVALYTSTNPRAISEYIRPIRMPLDIKSAKNCQSNMGERLHADVLDADPGLDHGLPAVLVRDRGGQPHLLPALVEGADHLGVLLRDEPAAHLPRPRHLS